MGVGFPISFFNKKQIANQNTKKFPAGKSVRWSSKGGNKMADYFPLEFLLSSFAKSKGSFGAMQKVSPAEHLNIFRKFIYL
ncbi:MAG: hypothetical protein NT085_01675 [candidate division SR1 bacterium]|nr:hypothetical protein [candidate division SR1 bacterium]